MKGLSETKSKKVFYWVLVIMMLALGRFVPISSKDYAVYCVDIPVKTHYTFIEIGPYNAAPTEYSPEGSELLSCVTTSRGTIGLYIL